MQRTRVFITRRIVLGLLCAFCLLAHGRADEGRVEVLGVDAIDSVLPVFDGTWFRAEREGEELPDLRVLLSRSRYWAQDGHLDVVVRLAGAALASGVVVEGHFSLPDGSPAGWFTIDPPAAAFVFYPKIPGQIAAHGAGRLEVAVRDGDTVIAEEAAEFRVEVFEEPVGPRGRVSIHVPNDSGVFMDGFPVSVGVPFPRGVLASTDRLRLVDGDGKPVALQVEERARWSKYGSVKWVLCDFTVNLKGKPVELFLEYGEERADGAEGTALQWIFADPEAAEFPALAGALLTIDNGLWWNADGGERLQLLPPSALTGAFVEHEDGRLFVADPAAPFVIEEAGPEKVIIHRRGWYRDPETGDTFCRFSTRFVVFRASPIIRVFHTWIFTGDGNRDRISNMGWRFDLDGTSSGEPLFLTGFDPQAQWQNGDRLLQYDYEHFLIEGASGVSQFDDGRAAGAAALQSGNVDLYFGAKDFWQNYPSELEVRDDALWFHNWPRRNLPARFTFDKTLIDERGGPAERSSAARYALEDPEHLTRSEWVLNVIQSRHAHEGEVLDFRLPDVYNEDPIWSDITSGQPHWVQGDVDTINAQGVSRTEEFWFVVDHQQDRDNATQLLKGLNDELFRAVVDPQWLATSGAFYNFHPHDPEQFPLEEEIYEQVALSPSRMAERLGIYGMWIYGDVPGWNPRLEIKEPVLYRAFRRHHLGWPYPWMPYLRSGDPRFHKWAEASTRRMIDTAWVHHVSADVDTRIGPDRHRRHGLVGISPIPWMGGSETSPFTRSTGTKVDYLLDCWYLTGYHPAWERALAWMTEMKVEEADVPGRGPFFWFTRASNSMLRACIDSWEATFDPWFLVAAHALSQGHLHGRSNEHEDGDYGGRGWDTGDREFHRFTGCETYRDFYLNRHAKRATSERIWSNWNRRHPQWQIKAYAWELTEDPFYLRRISHAVDHTTALAGDWNPYVQEARTAEREPWQLGIWEGNSFGGHYAFFTAYSLRWLPHALWALNAAGERPAPIYSTFNAAIPNPHPADTQPQLTVILRPEGKRSVPLSLSLGRDRHLGALPAPPPGLTAHYTLLTEDNSPIAEGTWRPGDEHTLPLPDDTAEIILQLTFNKPDAVIGMPLLESGSGGEVILTQPNSPTPAVGWRSLWFFVPKGVSKFEVIQSSPSAEILYPDGSVAWNATQTTDTPRQTTVYAPPNSQNKLWRINRPGHAQLSDNIPPVFAVEPDRWFMPKIKILKNNEPDEF